VKFHMGLLAAGAATMIAGTSMGASLGDIVIKGPMAERIHEKRGNKRLCGGEARQALHR